MTVTIPTAFWLTQGNGAGEFAMRQPIYTGSVVRGGVFNLVQNSTFAYSSCNRRALLNWGGHGHPSVVTYVRNPLLTSNASYETIFEQQATLSADTDRLGLVARAFHVDLRVTLWGSPDKTSSIAVWTVSAVAESTLTAGPTSISGDEDITIEVEARYNTSAPGSLFMLEVFEVELQASELP